MSKNKSSYEGLQADVRALKLPAIEVWKNQYPDKDYNIRVETKEFTCVCPKTGLPDFAEIVIEYTPDKSCIELKSFKEYLMSFRDIGIFHEHVINKILDDFVLYACPRKAKIIGIFNLRGGIQTTVSREYKKNTRH